MSSSKVTETPVNERRGLTASQMDVIGLTEDDTAQPVALDTIKDKVTPPSTPARAVALASRVDVGRPIEVPMEIEEDDDDDDVDADLERLLSGVGGATTSAKQTQPPSSCCGCGGGHEVVGNTRVICPRIFARTGWGMVGPHWFGPACVLLLLAWASHYFIRQSVKIGPITTGMCILFTLATIYYLLSASFRDPGIVRNHPETVDLSNWRWCDFCSVYQPPDGVHCPDCNVCVEGYDHHCVWMGTCIGKGNHRQFLRFNLSWLLYLVFAIAWVSMIAPSMYNIHS